MYLYVQTMTSRLTRSSLQPVSLASKLAHKAASTTPSNTNAHKKSRTRKRPHIQPEYERSKVPSSGEQDDVEEDTSERKGNPEPGLWREQLANIQEMRKHKDAPVDTMGCDVISDQTASPEVR